VLTTGRVAESLRWATQIMEAAETHRELDFRIVGHLSLANSYFWLGEPIKAREHADQVLSLYTEGRHDHLLDILNHDPKTFGLIRTALVSWMLGYNEQAIRIGDTRDAYARQRRHPFDLGFALTEGAWVFDHLGEPEELLKRAEEADQMGRENSLPIFTEFMVPVSSGIALIRMGQLAEGIASAKAGLSFWEQIGGGLAIPYIKSVLAQGIAQTGDLDGALNLIEESMAQAERPGWEERWYYAETLRVKAWLLSLKGDLEGAECNHIASLDWARRQQAKSWELRTAMSYARLMRGQGRTKEAYDLLAPVYAWFTEGFGTKDLRDAKTLLQELAA
jgi:predicted ATPase